MAWELLSDDQFSVFFDLVPVLYAHADGVPECIGEVPQCIDEVPHVNDKVPQVIDGVPRFIDETPQLAHGLPQLIDSQISDGLPQTSDGVPQVQDVSKMVHVPVDLCDRDFFSECEIVSSNVEESATEESATVMPNNAKPLSMPIDDNDSCMRHDCIAQLLAQNLESGTFAEVQPCCDSESEISQLQDKVQDLDALLAASLWLAGPPKRRKVSTRQWHLEPPVPVMHLG